jgi:hypothetical protein
MYFDALAILKFLVSPSIDNGEGFPGLFPSISKNSYQSLYPLAAAENKVDPWPRSRKVFLQASTHTRNIGAT